jgi:hypothetical protein
MEMNNYSDSGKYSDIHNGDSDGNNIILPLSVKFASMSC